MLTENSSGLTSNLASTSSSALLSNNSIFTTPVDSQISLSSSSSPTASPKVVLISLDGATPRLINQFLADGTLSPDRGLGLLASQGLVADQNITVTPSLTAPGHIAIATGSSAANNDINANSFHLVASPFTSNISGFSAPIGGYDYSSQHPAESSEPTANPLWLALRDAGKTVVAATFPGADGLNVTIPGLTNSPIVQPASERTVDYTVPFGAFAGTGAQGFSLTAADFEAAPQSVLSQLQAAGIQYYGQPLETKKFLDTFKVDNVTYNIEALALDTTNDGQTNYDSFVFFDAAQGIKSGPFSLPSTGPAIVHFSDQKSSLFYLEGSTSKAGTAFFVSDLAPDLSTVHIARYSANSIPRNAAVLDNVDDINNNVGFWAPQSDFRIPERLSPGFTNFSDQELEAIYEDQVRGFVDYQTRVALRGLQQFPNADLAMIYIEQPDGSEHQFLITDPRQATDPTNPNSIWDGQNPDKIARYQDYLRFAYQSADQAVQRIIDAVGVDSQGRPNSDIIVVSDHGFDPFHTAVDMNAYLKSKGFDTNQVRAVTSGPAVNVYINLQGREPNGTVSHEQYVTLQQKVASALQELVDANPYYISAEHIGTGDDAPVNVFDKIYTRPLPDNLNDASFGLGTSDFIGQDSGDVFALLTTGYNFDGTQTQPVIRLGDAPTTTPVLSVPNFYGAHGYDPNLPDMSAIFYAAGPDIGTGTINQVRNIDIAPTILNLLGVQPAATVQGSAIALNP